LTGLREDVRLGVCEARWAFAGRLLFPCVFALRENIEGTHLPDEPENRGGIRAAVYWTQALGSGELLIQSFEVFLQ